MEKKGHEFGKTEIKDPDEYDPEAEV